MSESFPADSLLTSQTSDRTPPSHELTLREAELRRLQDAIESIVRGESLIRRGLAGDQPRICYCGIDTIRIATAQAAEVIRAFRPADLRPDLTEAYLAQVVDDLAYVEAVAEARDIEQARRLIAEARAHLNGAMRTVRMDAVVAR